MICKAMPIVSDLSPIAKNSLKMVFESKCYEACYFAEFQWCPIAPGYSPPCSAILAKSSPASAHGHAASSRSCTRVRNQGNVKAKSYIYW